MRISKLATVTSLIVVLVAPSWCLGQEPVNTDQLRRRVRELESMKLADRTPSIQETQKRSLLSVYRQFQVLLQDDITSLENMKAMVPNGDTALHARIARQIQDLTQEWNATVDKIKELVSLLQTAGAPNLANAAPKTSRRPTRRSVATNTNRTVVTDSASAGNAAASNGNSSDGRIETDAVAISDNGNGGSATSSALAGDATSSASAAPATSSAPAAPQSTATPVPFVFAEADLAKCDPKAPRVLLGAIETTANSIVFDDNPDALSGEFPKIFVYSVLGGLSEEIAKLDRYRYMGETARTDVQVGASAKSSGSTSAIEKPGISELLAWSIEHGAITKQVNDTVLTLNTSPYALFAATHGDTPETYENYNFFSRLGVSASFDIDSNQALLANARRKQLREWSARFRLTGDRTTRSAGFSKYWEREVKPAIEKRLLALSSTESLFDAEPALRELSGKVESETNSEITAYLSKNPLTDKTDKTARAREIGKIILCKAHASIFVPLNTSGEGKIEITPQIRARIPQLVRGLADAHDAVNLARASLEKYLKELEERPLATFAYTNQRTDTGSDYSVFQFLYERKAFDPMKLIANAGVSFYHKPDDTINQQRVRDFNLALSFEGKTQSPFVSMEEDLSQITYSFTGSYQRLFENRHVPGKRADIGVAQFKIEFPVAMGFRLPFSVTYASASETSQKREVRANFGINLDTLKLLALRRLASLALKP